MRLDVRGRGARARRCALLVTEATQEESCPLEDKLAVFLEGEWQLLPYMCRPHQRGRWRRPPVGEDEAAAGGETTDPADAGAAAEEAGGQEAASGGGCDDGPAAPDDLSRLEARDDAGAAPVAPAQTTDAWDQPGTEAA